MTIQEMKEKKKEIGYTYSQIAELSASFWAQSRRFSTAPHPHRATIRCGHWRKYFSFFLTNRRSLPT